MAILTFINVWCLMLFFTFAFGTQKETAPLELDYAASPQAPHWQRKLIINTLLSLAATALFALIIHSGIIPVKDLLDT